MLSRISFLQNKAIIIIFMYLGVMYLAENDVCVYCEFISTENTAEKYAWLWHESNLRTLGC